MPDNKKLFPNRPSKAECGESINAVRDTLYVLGGKWKLTIIIALLEADGPQRFKEVQRLVKGITPKVLSKELKELELNKFVTRTVYDTAPVTVEYELTEYSTSLQKVLYEMRVWGLQHKKRLMECSKVQRAKS